MCLSCIWKVVINLQKGIICRLFRYHYDKAVKYALQAPKIQRETYKRERFDSLKVDPFIDFISSDIVVTGLPFGTKTLKLSNTKLEIPSTLRLQKHFEIIEMFENHMQERGQSHLVLPRSTMFHLLEVCSAKRTTAITCVDYFISNGIDGMNDIINLIDKWGQKGTFTLHDTKVLKHHVLESLQYLRTQYLVNVNETSNVPSHCAKHALSSATDGRMQANERDHEHDGFCERCLKLVKTMEKVNSLAKLQKENIEADDIVDQRLLREAEEDLSVAQNAIESIKKLQEHFLKSVYSDEYRKFIIENVIDDQTALLTIDFAQKYLQDWYKQTQQQYFARRGMSWEVTHVFIKKNGELLEHTFIHLIENEKQDARTVLAILKDVLLKLKEQNIVKVVARTDNAGCYHCKDVLMSLKHVIKETGVKILRWSFSEPQSGKSSADRKAATVKTRLRAHLDKKNNIESEADMFTALTNPHPLRYMTITRATVDSSTPVPNSVDSTPLPNSAPIAPKTFP
uniref:Transposase n=1 Tax=Panagrolaimus superbus TaxID=310955 RepID=A0A914ZE63_9BILA